MERLNKAEELWQKEVDTCEATIKTLTDQLDTERKGRADDAVKHASELLQAKIMHLEEVEVMRAERLNDRFLINNLRFELEHLTERVKECEDGVGEIRAGLPVGVDPKRLSRQQSPMPGDNNIGGKP